jgi:hypothetical protein
MKPPQRSEEHGNSGKGLLVLPLLLAFSMGVLFVAVLVKKKKNHKRNGWFHPLAGFASWWRRRRFYVAQEDTLLEEEDDSNSGRLVADNDSLLQNTQTQSSVVMVPNTSYFPKPIASTFNLPPPHPLTRSRTRDSFQGSLESMDSLVESYWDPDEETSQATAIASNIAKPIDFFVEHLGFLSVQTQAREVELLYDT